MSKLEVIIGPMFSQKCLSPETILWTFDGKIKLAKDLRVGDCLVNDLGNSTTVISINRGKTKMYKVKYYNDSYFEATENHILVCKYAKPYYSPLTKKRGILYYINENKKLEHIPVLYKYMDKVISGIKSLEIHENVEISIKEFISNRIYSRMLYMYKAEFYPEYFKNEIEIEKSLDDVLINGNEISKRDFLKVFINKFKTLTTCYSTTTSFKKESKLNDKILELVDQIEGVNCYDSNGYFAFSGSYLFPLTDNIEISLINITVDSLDREYVGFELDGNGRFLLGDFLVSHNSTFLINIINKYKIIDKKILVISHSLDATRYSTKFLSTHNDNSKIPCKFIDKLEGLEKEEDFIKADMIIIEEGQFFKDIEKFVINHLDNSEKHFIVSGLMSDVNRKPFHPFINLIVHADKIHKLEGFCNICKNSTPSIYTKKIDNEKHDTKENLVLIGSDNFYTTVCRKHYK